MLLNKILESYNYYKNFINNFFITFLNFTYLSQYFRNFFFLFNSLIFLLLFYILFFSNIFFFSSSLLPIYFLNYIFIYALTIYLYILYLNKTNNLDKNILLQNMNNFNKNNIFLLDFFMDFFCRTLQYAFILIGLLVWKVDYNFSQILLSDSILLNFNKMIIILLFLFINILLFVFINKKIFNESNFFKPETLFIWIFNIISLIWLLISNNFIFFYITLESFGLTTIILFSLLYGLKNKENGLKYFIINIISSTFILLSFSIFYGYFGSMNFSNIEYLNSIYEISENKKFSLALVLSLFSLSFFIKLPIIPFHIWIFDIYENINTSLFIYFLTATKLIIFSILSNFFFNIFSNLLEELYIFFAVFSIISVFIGIVITYKQKTLKRYLIGTSIVNSGLLIFSFIIVSPETYTSFQTFLFIYILTFFSFLLILFSFRKNNKYSYIKNISDFSYLELKPSLKFILTIYILSFSGIPPLLGFFLKYYFIESLIFNNNLFIGSLFLTLSIVSTYYYIQIFPYLFFHDLLAKDTLWKNKYKIKLFFNFTKKTNNWFTEWLLLFVFGYIPVFIISFIYYYETYYTFILNILI